VTLYVSLTRRYRVSVLTALTPRLVAGSFCRKTLSEKLAVYAEAAERNLNQDGGTALRYMIVEHFRNHDPLPVYRRFRDRGRLAPAGLAYISSWVDEKFERCFQLMEADDPRQIEDWIANWSDLVEFEVYPVISSNEAAEEISSRL
jgi:hypothetical protein